MMGQAPEPSFVLVQLVTSSLAATADALKASRSQSHQLSIHMKLLAPCFADKRHYTSVKVSLQNGLGVLDAESMSSQVLQSPVT